MVTPKKNDVVNQGSAVSNFKVFNQISITHDVLFLFNFVKFFLKICLLYSEICSLLANEDEIVS